MAAPNDHLPVEGMKNSELNFREHLRFHPEKGINSFHDSRIILFEADAIGLLRQNLLEELGWEQTQAFFLRLGFQHGYADFLQVKVNYEFDSERELLASGPVIHTWEGLVRAVPGEISYDRDEGTFRFAGSWYNSYEAEQHLAYNETSREPVCWSLTGYASGWCTAFFGKPLLALEERCEGMGHDHCTWQIKPPEAWGNEAAPQLAALRELLRGGAI